MSSCTAIRGGAGVLGGDYGVRGGLEVCPRSHLREHFEREIALLDAMPVRRAVYVGAPDVVAGHELE